MLLGIIVEFIEQVIIVNEDIELAQISVSLSNPLSSTITFEIFGTDLTAKGKLY